MTGHESAHTPVCVRVRVEAGAWSSELRGGAGVRVSGSAREESPPSQACSVLPPEG